MLSWTLKSLLDEPRGFLGSVAGVASAFLLVLFFQAVFRGESGQIVAYVSQTDADVWVMQRGVGNMHMATSMVWDWKEESVARVEGVAAVTPILYLNTVVRAGGRNWFAYVVGLRDGGGRGGPWSMAAGRTVEAPGEAVIPAVLARITGVGLGATITVAERRMTVVGLSRGTFSMANAVAFVHASDVEDVISTTGIVSYLLVKAAPGVDAAALAQRIEAAVEKVSALPRDAFVRNDFTMAMQMGLEIIGLMTFIGASLAALIVAFAAYSQVARQRRELAIARAVGFRNSALYLSVVAQSLITTAAGFLVAAVAVTVAVPLLPRLRPELSLEIALIDLAQVGGTALVVAVVAALVPAYLIGRVDPMTVFRN